MTPAITLLRRTGTAHRLHRYRPTGCTSGEGWGMAAAERLGIAPERVFKTLVVQGNRVGLAVAIVPVTARLDEGRMARALGEKRIAMAEPTAAERATGYVSGGISPLGQRRRLPSVLDESALRHRSIFVSGGRRGLELELAPGDLRELSGARVAAIADESTRGQGAPGSARHEIPSPDDPPLRRPRRP